MEFLKEWWPIVVAIGTGILGFRTAQDRNRWRLGAVEKRLEEIEADLRGVKDARSVDAVTLGIIQTTLEQIKGLIGEVREDLRGKADK